MTTPQPLPAGSLEGYSLQILNNVQNFPFGHSFIRITAPDGTQYNLGFAPADATGLTAYGTGTIEDNSGTTFQTSTNAILLTGDQYSSLSQFVNGSIANPPYYSALQGQECTAWAAEALDAALGTGGNFVPSNAATAFVQSVMYNPYAASAELDAAGLRTLIDSKFDALAQYGENILKGLSSSGSSPTTVDYGDGSILTINPTSTGGSVLLTDPSGNTGGSLQYVLNGSAPPVCTVTDPTGTGTDTLFFGGSAIEYAAGASPTITPSGNTVSAAFGSPAADGEVTINGQTFSEQLANTKAVVDAIGVINFINSTTGATTQILSPTSDGWVAQSLWNGGTVNQLTQKNFFAADGTPAGTIGFHYDSGSSTTPSAANITNGAGTALGSYTVNSDGSITFVNTDPSTGHVLLTTTVDASGHIINQTPGATADTTNNPAFVQAFVDTLATQLISDVLIKNSLPASLAATAFADAVVKSAVPTGGQNLTFAQDLAQSIADIAGGFTGSQVGDQIASALGLPSQVGSLAGGVTGNLLAQALFNDVANNVGITTNAGDVLTATNFAAGISGAAGALAGSDFASLIVTPNEAGEITGAVSAAVATAAAAEAIEAAFIATPFAGIALAFTVAFGSDFLGSIIGDIFGGLFGGQPSVGPDALALVYFNPATQQFYTSSLQEDNGGSTDGVASIAAAFNNSTNAVLAAIGGTVVNSPAHLSFIMFEGSWYYVAGDVSPRAAGVGSTDATAIVNGAAYDWLRSLQISGGNPYMEWVLQHSPATNYTDLLSDLSVARDYGLYVTNSSAFELGLLMSGNPANLTTWETELARAHTLGLDQLMTGYNFLGNAGADLIARDQATGQISVWESTGGNVTLTNTNGSVVTLGTTENVIGTGANFGNTGSHDLFTRDSATGAMHGYEFNNLGQLVFSKALSNPDGSVFTVNHSTNVVGNAANFAGTGEADTVTRDSATGQVGIYGFNSSGQKTFSQTLSNADGTPYVLADNSEVIGTSVDYLGTGGRDIFIRTNGTGALSVAEFDASGKLTGSEAFLAGDGVQPAELLLSAGIVGIGSNFMGTGGQDVFEQSYTPADAGQIVAFEFNAAGKWIAGANLTNIDGSYFTLPYDSEIAGAATNVLGAGGHDLVVENYTNQLATSVAIYEFNSSGQNVASTIQNVLGTTLNLFNAGEKDLVTQDSGSGQVWAWKFDGTGKLMGGQIVTSAVVGSGTLSVSTANELLAASSSTINIAANNSQLLGSGDTVSVANNETAGIGGSNNAITLGSGDTLNITGGSANTINSTANTINVASNASATINGGGNAVTGAAGAAITEEGTGQYGWANTTTMSGGKLTLADDTSAEVVGSNNTIILGNSGMVGIDTGSDNAITVSGTDGNVWIEVGDANTINASGAVISFAGNVTNTSIIGNNDAITAASGDILSITGTGDTLSLQGISSVGATATRSNNDLVITGSGTTGHVTVQNYFLGSNEQPASVQFSDGTTWTPAFIASLFVSHAAAQATINGSTTVALANVRVGTADSTALSISNTATGAGEKLDSSVGSTTGDETASGSISQLAAAGTDTTDMLVGVSSATAGHKSGSVSLNFSSDGSGIDNNGVTSLASQTVQVSGNVYRTASAAITALPSNPVVHVGDTVTENVTITNSASADGYSEKLTASVATATSGLTATGTTGDIAAQASSSAIHVGISTAQAGSVSGTVTLNLASDGAGVDGLSALSLSQQTVGVTATVNNYARTALEEVSGGGTFAQSGNNYTLTYNLPTGASSATFNLGALNNISGPSDLLSGSFATSGPGNFALSGFGNFSNLGAGQADTAPTVTFNGSTPGTYTETITLHSTGSNASGYSGALADEMLTITVNVAAATPGQTESIAVFGQVVSLATLPNYGTVLGTGVSFDGSGNQSNFTRNTSTGQVDVSEFDASGNITFAAALTSSSSPFTVASGTTVIDTAQNLLGSNGYDIVTQTSGGAVGVQEFNAAGQLLASHAETKYAVANGGTLSVSGANDLIVGSGATVTLGSSATAALLHGSNDTVSLANNDSLTAVGSSDTFTLGSGNTLNINAGTSHLVNATGDTINVAATAAVMVNGGGDTISGVNGATISVEGNGEWGWNNQVNLSSGTINVSHDTSTYVTGGYNIVTGTTNDQVGINSGDHNVITVGSGSDVWVSSGTGTIINTSGSEIDLNTNVTGVTIVGSNLTINAQTGDNFDIKGSNITVNGSHLTLYLDANTTNVTLNGSNDIVHIRSGDTGTINGTSDPVTTDTVLSVTDGATINNFNGSTQLVDLQSLTYDSSITLTKTINGSSGTLTVQDHSVTVDTIHLTNITSIGNFIVRPDGSGGTLLQDPVDETPKSPTDGLDQFVFRSAAGELGGSPTHTAPFGISPDAQQFTFHANELVRPVNPLEGIANIGAELVQKIESAIGGAGGLTHIDAAPSGPAWEQYLHSLDGFHLT